MSLRHPEGDRQQISSQPGGKQGLHREGGVPGHLRGEDVQHRLQPGVQQLSLQVGGGRDHHRDGGMPGHQEDGQDRLLTGGRGLSLLQGGVQYHHQQGEQLHQFTEQGGEAEARVESRGSGAVPDQELAGGARDQLQRREGGPGHTGRDQGDLLTEPGEAGGDQGLRARGRADHLPPRGRVPASRSRS